MAMVRVNGFTIGLHFNASVKVNVDFLNRNVIISQRPLTSLFLGETLHMLLFAVKGKGEHSILSSFKLYELQNLGL